MKAIELSNDQLARAVNKARVSRRDAIAFLKECGLEGSAEDLEALLGRLRHDPKLRTAADQQLMERAKSVCTIDMTHEGRVAEMLADISVRMREQGLTQQAVAERCGWNQPQVAAYLTGAKEPGIGNLAKLAAAVGRVWRLTAVE